MRPARARPIDADLSPLTHLKTRSNAGHSPHSLTLCFMTLFRSASRSSLLAFAVA